MACAAWLHSSLPAWDLVAKLAPCAFRLCRPISLATCVALTFVPGLAPFEEIPGLPPMPRAWLAPCAAHLRIWTAPSPLRAKLAPDLRGFVAAASGLPTSNSRPSSTRLPLVPGLRSRRACALRLQSPSAITFGVVHGLARRPPRALRCSDVLSCSRAATVAACSGLLGLSACMSGSGLRLRCLSCATHPRSSAGSRSRLSRRRPWDPHPLCWWSDSRQAATTRGAPSN